MIGRTISHYKIVDKLGEGGMGAVYKAEDTTLNRLVAIKALSSHLSDNDEAQERFVREAQAASSLNHSNITTVYELLEDEGEQFIVMEYVDGKTIRDVVESSRVSIRKAVDTLIQAAEALEAAHNKGILHRDVKSANIMISMEGNVKVMDFGLAHLEERSQLTRTGTTMGTVAYSSPEQLVGAPVDRRSEIFSLGVVFYELLTGQLPFKSPSEGELVFEIINTEQEMLTSCREDVPENICSVVNKMLIKKPELRYQSCGELIGDLNAIRSELETTTVEISTALPAMRAKRRNQFAIGVVLIGIIIGAVFLLLPGKGGPDLNPNQLVVIALEDTSTDSDRSEKRWWAANSTVKGLMDAGFTGITDYATALQVTQNVVEEIRDGKTVNLIRTVAEETGAGTVITIDSYMVDGITEFQAQITDARNGNLLKSLSSATGQEIESDRDALATLLDQVLSFWNLRIGERIIDTEISSGRIPSFEASKVFKEGLEQYIAADRDNAILTFYRASQLDPTYASPLIYAGIELRNDLGNVNFNRPAELDSILAVLTSLHDQYPLNELDRCWMTWLVESTQRTQGFGERRLAAIKRAAEIAPGSKAVFNYATALIGLNYPREAIKALDTLDPERGPMKGWYPYFAWKCDAYHMLGEHAEELETVRQARELYPEENGFLYYELLALSALGNIDELNELMEEYQALPPTGSTPAYRMRQVARELKTHGHGMEIVTEYCDRAIQWYENERGDDTNRYRGSIAYGHFTAFRWEEARALFEEMAAEYPEISNYQCYLCVLAARRGDREEALRIRESLEQFTFTSEAGRIKWYADIATQLGDYAEAVRLVQEYIRLAPSGWHQNLSSDWDLEPLWDNPQYQELMRPKG
ncbi:protein kinase [Gemmatimonadota bacterium]